MGTHGVSPAHDLTAWAEGRRMVHAWQDQAFQLECFEPGESLDFMSRMLDGARQADGDTERRLAAQLGHLPLAMAMACAYMRRYAAEWRPSLPPSTQITSATFPASLSPSLTRAACVATHGAQVRRQLRRVPVTI
jgi:hypothetical protein